MSILETLGWIVLIAIILALVCLWWWIVWVCVGIFMVYFNIPGELVMQVFLWFVVNAIIGALGRIGMSAFQ